MKPHKRHDPNLHCVVHSDAKENRSETVRQVVQEADSMSPVPIIGSTVYVERFWSYVRVRPSGCWEWTGAKCKGYGVFHSRGRTFVYAYDFAWELKTGCQVPANLEHDHLCRNRTCVNPDHLEQVTQRVNIARGNGASAVNARKTHCIRGHSLSSARINRLGARVCRICERSR